MKPVHIDMDSAWPFTDELVVEFYICPSCEFARIPHIKDDDYARECAADVEVTAKFCPGCGAEIVWEKK